VKTILLLSTLLFTVACDKYKHVQNILKYGSDLTQQIEVCESQGGGEYPGCQNITINFNSFAVTHYYTKGKNRVILYHNCVQNTSKFFMGVESKDWNDLEDYISSLEGSERDEAFFDFIVENLNKFGLLKPQDGGHHFTYVDKEGNKVIFSENQTSIKDLEAIGAQMEDYGHQELSEKLTAEYGLSVDRAKNVAKSIQAYKKITTKRSLTAKEQDFFSQNLLGVDYKKVSASFTSGEGMDELLERAADVNGTSPEQVSAIINEVFL
jgi:hypothetical protein